MPPFSLVIPPAGLASLAFGGLHDALLLVCLRTLPGFGARLKPRYIIRASAFDQ